MALSKQAECKRHTESAIRNNLSGTAVRKRLPEGAAHNQKKQTNQKANNSVDILCEGKLVEEEAKPGKMISQVLPRAPSTRLFVQNRGEKARAADAATEHVLLTARVPL